MKKEKSKNEKQTHHMKKEGLEVKEIKTFLKKEASKGNKFVLKNQNPIIKTSKVLGIYNSLQEARHDLLKKGIYSPSLFRSSGNRG